MFMNSDVACGLHSLITLNESTRHDHQSQMAPKASG